MTEGVVIIIRFVHPKPKGSLFRYNQVMHHNTETCLAYNELQNFYWHTTREIVINIFRDKLDEMTLLIARIDFTLTNQLVRHVVF
jgi:hypothetical protein